MGKTAPSSYPIVPSSRLLPMEPVLVGAAAPPLGLEDLAQGVNHLARVHLPQIVNQPMQFTNWVGAGRPYLSTQDQPVAGAQTLRLVYRFPGIQNQAGAVQLRYRYLVAADVGTTGVVTTQTTFGGPVAHTHVGTGNWVWITAPWGYQPGITETAQISTHTSAGAGHFAIKHVSMFIEPGSSPTPWGLDVEGWQDDEPLAVHLRRTAASRLDWLAKWRRAQVCAWSADIANMGRAINVTNGTLVPFARSPVKYGPLCSNLVYLVSGYQTGGYSCKLWTNSGGYGAAASLVLPAAGGWTPTTTWVTGTLPVEEDKRQRSDELNMELFAAPAATTTLAGLCVHEELG